MARTRRVRNAAVKALTSDGARDRRQRPPRRADQRHPAPVRCVRGGSAAYAAAGSPHVAAGSQENRTSHGRQPLPDRPQRHPRGPFGHRCGPRRRKMRQAHPLAVMNPSTSAGSTHPPACRSRRRTPSERSVPPAASSAETGPPGTPGRRPATDRPTPHAPDQGPRTNTAEHSTSGGRLFKSDGTSPHTGKDKITQISSMTGRHSASADPAS